MTVAMALLIKQAESLYAYTDNTLGPVRVSTGLIQTENRHDTKGNDNISIAGDRQSNSTTMYFRTLLYWEFEEFQFFTQ